MVHAPGQGRVGAGNGCKEEKAQAATIGEEGEEGIGRQRCVGGEEKMEAGVIEAGEKEDGCGGIAGGAGERRGRRGGGAGVAEVRRRGQRIRISRSDGIW